jgi:hypothetical protein
MITSARRTEQVDNALARALQEYGRLAKTLFILRYLQRPDMRKRVGRQLNKGESLNGLRETGCREGSCHQVPSMMFLRVSSLSSDLRESP